MIIIGFSESDEYDLKDIEFYDYSYNEAISILGENKEKNISIGFSETDEYDLNDIEFSDYSYNEAISTLKERNNE